MKKLRLLLMVMLAMTFSGYLFAQFAGDGFKNNVIGSPHDLSVTGAAGKVLGGTPVSTGTVVCEFCHSPHKGVMNDAQPGEPGAAVPLLWNITLPPGPFLTYGNVGSSTFQATTRDPSTATKDTLAAYMTYLCLSCHDGTVTQASFLTLWNDAGEPGMGTVGNFTPPNIGQGGGLGLSNDHPLDFTYDSKLASAVKGLQTPLEVPVGGGTPYFVTSVGAGNLPLFKDKQSDLSGRLECATCHNPHDDTTHNKFLRIDNTGSALCLNCHGS